MKKNAALLKICSYNLQNEIRSESLGLFANSPNFFMHFYVCFSHCLINLKYIVDKQYYTSYNMPYQTYYMMYNIILKQNMKW